MGIPGYPKVFQLGHKEIGELLLPGEIVVQEKIDGSQFSFMKSDEGDVLFKSHKCNITPDSAPNLFEGAVAHVLSVQDRLIPGQIYRGEVLSKPKHNTLAYSRIPKNHIALFDIELGVGQGRFATPWSVQVEARQLEVECVPMFYNNTQAPEGVLLDRIKEWLELESCLGGVKIEGVVIKNYSRFNQYQAGWVQMGKYVSEAFKERNREAWRPGVSIVDSLIEALHTEARWLKAVQNLKECGQLLNEPKDIGALVRIVHADIKDEEAAFIAEKLYNNFVGQILKGSTSGLAEWYKEELAKQQPGVGDGKTEDTEEVQEGS